MCQGPCVPIERVLQPPSMQARYTSAAILAGIFALWGRFTFISEEDSPPEAPLHSWKVPCGLTLFYLVSLPLLRAFTARFLKDVNVKLMLHESMVIYNAGQVLLNAWMVYRFVDAVLFRGHHFMGGPIRQAETGAVFAVWVHYCDKYLEYLDTYFMILRGKMDQVSFLHVYHHTSIAIAWWIGLRLHPGGDIYFGALFNSLIHVMMYSYYLLSLFKIPCPWKKYLTMAQLFQFSSVILHSAVSVMRMDGGAGWGQYTCHIVQDFEMASLFVLFMAFFRKSYSNKLQTQKIASSDISVSTEDTDSVEEEN